MKQGTWLSLLLLLQFLVVRLSRAACPPADERALLAVAALFNYGSGYSSSPFESWGEGDCCAWEGVTCAPMSTASNIIAVTELSLSLPFLGSHGPHQLTPICNLTALRRLQLQRGCPTLLPCIANLRHLRYLDLSDNLINSIPPSSLAQLPRLHTLILHDNAFADTLSLISAALPSSLRTLDLHYNRIRGSIPASLFHLHPSLQYLDLSGNSLSGTLPASLFDLHPSLQYLDLSDNSQLSGTLPTTLTSPNSSLQTLQIRNTGLSGAIPPSIALLHSLRTLDLSSNLLTNSLPESMYNLTQLQIISLSSNSLTGSISPSIHKLQALRVLDLSFNLLSGPVPPELGSLFNLSVLYFSYNNLDPAPFPPLFGNLSNLEYLFLSYNSFNSSIPSEWRNLTLLSGLHLSGNALSPASLPSWIFRPPLAYLELSSLQLPSASFACDVLRYVNSTITELDLSLNNLNSTALLNDCLTRFSFPSLTWLNLSHNPLHSSLISSSKLLTPDLQLLHLGSCGLQGSIPDNFVPDGINDLNLSDNQLSGELPAGFRNFSKIEDMDLSHNNFTSSKLRLNKSGVFTLLLSNNEFKGELEHFLGNIFVYEVLDVSFNQFTGIIPPYLGNQSNMHIWRLKMGNNKLKGVIPAELGSLVGLTTLSLHGNQLVGTIPSTLFNCSSLQVLDLGQNALHGRLEDVFFSSTGYNLSALRVLLLGYNQLGGPIPSSLGMSSPNLQLLDLSNNHFNGSIPPHLHLPGFIAAATDQQSPRARTTSSTLAREGTLFEDDIIINAKGLGMEYTYILNVLTSLDLSGNSLSGSIPPTLGELTGLMFLNISRNHLTGSIPIELCKLGALESLDLSFNNLTGSIPKDLKDISSLEVFNISFNEELHGAIPAGAQLTDPNSYLGDKKLCGSPLQACAKASITSTQAAKYPQDHKKSAALNWIEGWASIPGIIIGLSVGYILTLCVLHIKLNGTSMFERLFNLLKGHIIVYK